MTPAAALSQLASDVRDGLCHPGQKTLPSRWFYDDLGSALFEAITALPEYGLTRADLRLIEAQAPVIARMAASGGAPVRVFELGSGGGRKARPILEALGPVDYHPIDVSGAALEFCRRETGSAARVHPIQATYTQGIDLASSERRTGERLLVLFLGGNIGNFDPPCAKALLDDVRRSLEPGDAFLLGADLLKPASQLLAAYDDPLGVTAAFNRNVLVRINRELGAGFDLANFAHVARYDAAHRRIEMHLRALGAHSVELGDLEMEVRFQAGETIWTESSHKFDLAALAAMAERARFGVAAVWVDRQWPFAESLWIAK